jgi:hypothetical protein
MYLLFYLDYVRLCPSTLLRFYQFVHSYQSLCSCSLLLLAASQSTFPCDRKRTHTHTHTHTHTIDSGAWTICHELLGCVLITVCRHVEQVEKHWRTWQGYRLSRNLAQFCTHISFPKPLWEGGAPKPQRVRVGADYLHLKRADRLAESSSCFRLCSPPR